MGSIQCHEITFATKVTRTVKRVSLFCSDTRMIRVVN